MRREPLGRGGSLATLALTLLSCGPSIEAVGPIKNGSTDGAVSVHEGAPASSEADSVPTPPPRGSAPKIQAPLVVQAPERPRICGTMRPDLPRSFFEIRIEQALSPEEHLLLGHWIRASLSQDFDSLAWDVPPCTGSMVCVSVPVHETAAFAESLAKVVSAPPLVAFYPARAAAIEQGRQSFTDPRWRVHATMRTLLHPSPLVEQALAVRTQEELVDLQADQTLERILEHQSGNLRLSLLSPGDMKELLKEALSSAQVTIAGPAAPSLTLNAFERGWTASPPSSVSSPSDVRGATEQKIPELVRLTEDADNWSYASTAWEHSQVIDQEATLVGLSILAERIRRLTPPEVIVEVPLAFQRGNTFTLDLRGPYEQVLEALPWVREQAIKLISAAGTPNLVEIKNAHLSLAVRSQQSLEPRCIPSRESLDARTITNALRRLGRAHSVVWGRAAEQQPDDAP